MADFPQLWAAAVKAAEEAGQERLKSTLINHSAAKERVCRKLGIVSETDIERIIRQLKRRFHRSTGAAEPRRRQHKHG